MSNDPRPVVMVGLYGALREPNLFKFEKLPDLPNARYWTLNDCWELKGVQWERIYQIHRNFEQLAEDRPSCYRNWKPRYNATGATIVFGDDKHIDGIDRQMIFPWNDAISEFGLDYFQSSFNAMVAHAILEGVKTIYIRRCKLNVGEEYDTQARALLYAIYDAEKRGVTIDCPWRLEWEERFAREDVKNLPALTEPYDRYIRKKTAAFIGFYAPDLQYLTLDDLRWGGADLWTVNDFYRILNFKPDRVYNPCDDTFTGHAEDPSRFSNWKEEYNKAGSEIVTIDHVSGLNNQRKFDFKRGAKDFGLGFFTSSFSYMFAEAIWQGYEHIKLYGIRLAAGGEHHHQVPGILHAIDECRRRGITVDAPYEEEWRSFQTADWANIKPGIIPYWHKS